MPPPIPPLPALPAFSLIRLHDGGVSLADHDFVRDKSLDLSADAAQEFCALWPRLVPCRRGGMRCYVPGYEVSLWDGAGREVFSAAFCWRCHHIGHRGPGARTDLFAWDSDQPEAAALLELFDSFLPYERRKGLTERCPGCGHSWEGLPVGGDCPGCKLRKWEERRRDTRP